ncbi:MAG: zinc ribbon domain-containing protein [Deltaproteobacteria bacterium]|nr:zinc ribbon domain-containing protein [Deltaproteobacteria bacterium]
MPTYEYACDACGHEFELEQRMSEAPAKTCAKCGEDRARRQISQGNFILKGGGWYSDLYSSSKKSKKSGDGTSTASSGGESKESSKSESGAKSDGAKSDGGTKSDSGSSKSEAKAA